MIVAKSVHAAARSILPATIENFYSFFELIAFRYSSKKSRFARYGLHIKLSPD
jgi:hypothetical protein